MRMPRGTNEAPARNWIELGPDVAARMALVSEPAAALVLCYTLTRGAERAWSAINSQLTQPRGELFWIGGAADTGKTHFLNYAVALSNRAAASDTASGRYLTVIADAERTGAGELDRQILEQLALQLAGDSRSSSLWRRVDGAEGLTIAFDYARRQGVKGVTAAVDLGERDIGAARAQLETLTTIAREFRQLRLIVLAAGRADACEGARSFVVAPDADEELTVICGRARHVNDNAWPRAAALYRNLQLGSWEPRQIYPLHPAAAEGLMRLIAGGGGIASGAAMLREAIELWDVAKRHDGLLMPAELMRSSAAQRELESNLGDAERTGFALLRRAAAGLPETMQAAAHALIDTFALRYLSETAGVEPANLFGCLPPEARITAGEEERLAAELAARSHGIIRYKSSRLYFNPQAAGTPELTAFNQALGLARRFDSSLTAATEAGELKIKTQRLEEALTGALERCHHNRELLAAAMKESNGGLSGEQQRTFEAYGELVEGGTEALIGLAGDAARRDDALKVMADYEALAAVALAAPRLRAMREYLEATGLMVRFDGDSTLDRAVATVETECQLLKAAVAPAALISGARNLDALEARFHQFKWSYSQLYRDAHTVWCREIKQLTGLADDARLHLEALRRLNGITALGEPVGQDLSSRIHAAVGRIRDCDPDAPMVLEVRPRCPQCDFVIGAISPKAESQELLEQTRRGLNAKLSRLSQSTIARLIEENDHNGKLEGFLKITQAAQTDALVRVLDDKLAAYLTELLNEKFAGTVVNGSAPEVAATGSAHRARPQRLGVAKNPPGSSSRR
jgi:hypothetical protein